MARPQKDGLDYFPLDVDIDQDEKVALVEAQHGPVGFAIVIKIFMKIYRNGYFYEWGEKEQLLFSKLINVDINLVNVVINDCLKWGLFNHKVFESSKVLTSKGIQKRYLEATGRRNQTRIIEDFCLLSEDELNAYRNIVIVDINGNSIRFINFNNPQSKVKESKGKKSKEDKKEQEEYTPQNPFIFFEENGFGTLGPTIRDEIGDWIDGNFFDEPEAIIVEAMKEAIRNDKKNLGYVNRILTTWSQHQVKTLNQALASIEKWKNRSKSSGRNDKRVAPEPKWMNGRQIVEEKPPEEIKQRQKELEEMLNNL